MRLRQLIAHSIVLTIVEPLRKQNQFRIDRFQQIKFCAAYVVEHVVSIANIDSEIVAHSWWHPLSCSIGLPAPILAHLL